MLEFNGALTVSFVGFLLPPLMFELKVVVFGLNCERQSKLVI